MGRIHCYLIVMANPFRVDWGSVYYRIHAAPPRPYRTDVMGFIGFVESLVELLWRFVGLYTKLLGFAVE